MIFPIQHVQLFPESSRIPACGSHQEWLSPASFIPGSGFDIDLISTSVPGKDFQGSSLPNGKKWFAKCEQFELPSVHRINSCFILEFVPQTAAEWFSSLWPSFLALDFEPYPVTMVLGNVDELSEPGAQKVLDQYFNWLQCCRPNQVALKKWRRANHWTTRRTLTRATPRTVHRFLPWIAGAHEVSKVRIPAQEPTCCKLDFSMLASEAMEKIEHHTCILSKQWKWMYNSIFIGQQ